MHILRSAQRLVLIPFFSAVILLAGCGEKKDNSVPVQSVAMLCGLSDVMQQQVFAGIVSTGNEANIKKDSNKKVAKVNVKKGDIVNEGDILFVYDVEQAQNSLDKALLELEEQKNALQSKIDEKAQLEEDKQKAGASDQLEYTLKIQETDTDIRETQYNIGIKEKEILKLEEGTQNLEVTAPFAGRIEKAGVADTGSTEISGSDDITDLDDDYDMMDSDGSGEAFIKLVETDNYRVKGTIDESNIRVISVGMEMLIHSRINDVDTWRGVVSDIDYKSPKKGSGDGSYGYDSEDGDSEMTSSSKYPFYVSLDALDGLMIGQHVYMTEYLDGEEESNMIRLSSSYIMDADSSPWVWAEVGGSLGKKRVTLGEYSEEDDTYIIESGITLEDYIAVPSERYNEGMPVTENDLSAFEVDENAAGYDYEDYAEEEFGDEEFADEEYDGEEYDDEEYYDDEEFYDEEDFEGEEVVG